MIFNLKEITSILDNIATFTSGDKQIPGVLIDSSDESGIIKIRYSDGKKSFTRDTTGEMEESDTPNRFALNYEQFVRAIGTCKPSSNSIRTETVQLKFEEKIVKIKAEQYLVLGQSELDDEDILKLVSTKELDVPYIIAGSDKRSELLIRARYDDIFDEDGADVWNIDEFTTILGKLTGEQGRIAYLVANWKLGFVSNMSYMTVVPINFDFVNNVQLHTNTAKALTTILSKIKSDLGNEEVYIKYKDDQYIVVFTEDKKFGLWVDAAKANKMHVSTLKMNQSLEYSTYQINVYRELLTDAIKTALKSTNSDKLAIKFEKTSDPNNSDNLELVIKTANSNASSGNETRILIESYIDANDNITTQEFPISLKVIESMLDKLESEVLAFDINISENGTKTFRLADFNIEKMLEQNKLTRERLGLPELTSESIADGTAVPTPVEEKLSYRINTIETSQYSIMQKA